MSETATGADIMAEPEYDYGYGRFRAVRGLLPWIFRRAAVLRAYGWPASVAHDPVGAKARLADLYHQIRDGLAYTPFDGLSDATS